jgi:hypothetical protein
MARDPALKPYRIAVYSVYAVVCGVLFVQLFRSVVGDLYGREPVSAVHESPTACLEDVQRLWDQLSARAVQPAPGGIESNALSKEWDAWSRRWENEVATVSARCNLDSPKDAAARSLADALESIEDLRRRLSRSGEDAAEDARRVKDSLADARKQLGLK